MEDIFLVRALQRIGKSLLKIRNFYSSKITVFFIYCTASVLKANIKIIAKKINML